MTDAKLPLTRHVVRIPRQTKTLDVIRVPSDAADVLVHLEAGAEAVVVIAVASGVAVSHVEVVH